MYSEQELTKIIGDVFDQKIEAGAFNESIADAVDAYLVEHPVDITALEGQDIAPKDISATGNITAPSIIETMSGYSFTPATSDAKTTLELIYAGIVKNGDKLTLVVAANVTKISSDYRSLGTFIVPSTVYAKLYTVTVGGYQYLSIANLQSVNDSFADEDCRYACEKPGSNIIAIKLDTSKMSTTKTYIRIEQTFLLSDNLIPQD